MSKFKGTKGPWVQNGINAVHTDQGKCIAITYNKKREDAILISKAPEMLEMLEELREIFDKYEVNFQSQFFKYKEPLEKLIKSATEL